MIRFNNIGPIIAATRRVLPRSLLGTPAWNRQSLHDSIPPYISKAFASGTSSPQQTPSPPQSQHSPSISSNPTDRKLRRFYKSVTVEKHLLNQSNSNDKNQDGHSDVWLVVLDGRPLKTPGGNPLALPNEATALLIASEWDLQTEFVKFELMPLTNLAIQTLDLISHGDTRVQVESETLKYLQTDSALFRVGSKTSSNGQDNSVKDRQLEALAIKQRELLDPILRQIEGHYRLEKPLKTSDSLESPQQYQPDLDVLASILKKKTLWELGCLFTVVRNLKSYVLGVSLLDGFITVKQGCQAASLEESHQRDHWGEVEGNHDVENATIRMWLNSAVLLQNAVRKAT